MESWADYQYEEPVADTPKASATHSPSLASIEIYNPTEIPFGALSNNLIQYITVKRQRYPSVSNFIYSNCVDFGSNKEILRNASTKRPTKKINIEAKLDFLMSNYEVLNKRAMNPSEIASLKRKLLLSVDAKHLSVYETFVKTLHEERSVYCVEALTTLFQHYSTQAENWLSALTNTGAKDIYYVMEDSSFNEESSLNSILGVDSKGIGDNLCGKMLMEIRNNVYRKHLSQRTEKDERQQKEMVFAKFLAVVAFLQLLKSGDLPSANDTILADRMTKIRESGGYNIETIFRMYKEGRLTRIDGIDDVPMGAPLIPNIVRQLFEKFKAEYKIAYNQKRVEIVWETFLRTVINDKYPAMTSEELEKNVHNYYNLVFRSEHSFFEIVDGDTKTVVERAKLLQTMKNLIYITYLQNKLPPEVQQKIDDALKEAGHQGYHFSAIDNNPVSKKLETVEEGDDGRTKSSSSSSSSSSDDEIKRALRDRPLETSRKTDVAEAWRNNEMSLKSKIEALTNSPSILAGLPNKSGLEMERIYRKLLYEELGIPIPYRENVAEMLIDIKRLSGNDNVSLAGIEAIREKLSFAIANAEEKDIALVKEINSKLRVSYSIYELEQKLRVMRTRKQVESREDLQDIHQVIRAEKKHGEREHLLLPLYEEALERGTFETSIKVFHDVSKNTDSLSLLSLLHKQTPVFKGDVRISNEGHPIVRGFENGMEYVMCYLMSKIRILGESEKRPDVVIERPVDMSIAVPKEHIDYRESEDKRMERVKRVSEEYWNLQDERE